MKNLLKVFAVLMMIISSSSAGLVDAVSVIIDNQPITLYEIYKYADKLHISKKVSLEILIRQKLEDAQIKKLGITVSNFEVNSYIKKIATKNNMSEFSFLQMLKTKGIEEDQYRIDLKKKIEREKLYAKIFASKQIRIKLKDLQKYYNENRSKFTEAQSFETVMYESKNKQSLEKIRQNPMLSFLDIKSKQVKFQSENMDKNLEVLLNQTKNGEFTPVLKTVKGYTLFYLKAKNGIQTLPFKQVKQYIYSLLNSQKEKIAIDDYFQKIKSTIQVKVLRRPN